VKVCILIMLLQVIQFCKINKNLSVHGSVCARYVLGCATI
jgi:hypothetical protein